MIRIITDTSSDLTLDEAKKLGVTLLPMTIQFGERTFKDRYEMEPDEFYRLLISYDEIPVTSQVNPYEFETVFDEVEEAGDEAVVITLSSGLSGTFQSANIAKGDREFIHIVDSLGVTVSQQCLVRLAVTLRDKGMSAADIAAEVTREVKNVKVLGLLDTLEYLKKGGRLSAAAAIAGGVLSIKPVLTTTPDGQVTVIGKARGSKNGNNLLKKMIGDCGGIDFSKPIVIAYSGTSKDLLDQYLEDNKDLYEGHEDSLSLSRIGSTIGTHAGPGTIAVGFFPRE